MENAFRKGARAPWHWGAHEARGTGAGRFERRLQRTTADEKTIRHGNAENPAYLVEQAEGTKALKLGSELWME